jgi:phosphoglycolate phosphatase-like HAD superfamily hydrolase
MPIILFDIDGTLVRTGGAGKAAMETALREEFQIQLRAEEIPYSGRTDRAIGSDLLRAHGVEPTAANLSRLIEGYLARLPGALGAYAGVVCPGVKELISALRPRADVLLGLLTGNVRRGAERKLGHYGLWGDFPVGGFGDEHPERDDVARAALRSVESHVGGAVNPADVWVIGDTPLDVRCARAIGARAVAVATGWHELDDLRASGPDFALADLSDPRELLSAWHCV